MNKEIYDRGLEIRRSVLGSEYVDTALKNADDFTGPLQDLVTEYCWGWAWGREELSKRDRSLITVSALISLNRTEQLPFHLNKALENGVTREELIEIITHLAFYAGWPNAMTAVRIAKEVFAA